MSVTTTLLRELHRIHQQLSDLRERLERGPKQIKAHQTNVTRAEAAVVQVKADQKAAKLVADQKQLLLRSGETKLADLRVKLNQASSNREYQALLDQIAADEMAGSVLADEILEALEAIDVFAPQLVTAEQELVKSREELARVQQQVQEKQGLIEGDVVRLEAELHKLEATLPGDFAEAYQRIVKGRGSDAMAQVDSDTCGGCYQKVTANKISSLMMSRVVFCQSCGRLLYLPENTLPGRS